MLESERWTRPPSPRTAQRRSHAAHQCHLMPPEAAAQCCARAGCRHMAGSKRRRWSSARGASRALQRRSLWGHHAASAGAGRARGKGEGQLTTIRPTKTGAMVPTLPFTPSSAMTKMEEGREEKAGERCGRGGDDGVRRDCRQPAPACPRWGDHGSAWGRCEGARYALWQACWPRSPA